MAKGDLRWVTPRWVSLPSIIVGYGDVRIHRFHYAGRSDWRKLKPGWGRGPWDVAWIRKDRLDDEPKGGIVLWCVEKLRMPVYRGRPVERTDADLDPLVLFSAQQCVTCGGTGIFRGLGVCRRCNGTGVWNPGPYPGGAVRGPQ